LRRRVATEQPASRGNEQEAGLLDRLPHRAAALLRRSGARQITHEGGFRLEHRRNCGAQRCLGAPPADTERQKQSPEPAADGERAHFHCRSSRGRLVGPENDQRRERRQVAGVARCIAPDPRQDRREAPHQRERARRPDERPQKNGEEAAGSAADGEGANRDKTAARRPTGIDEGDPEADQGGPGQRRVAIPLGREQGHAASQPAPHPARQTPAVRIERRQRAREAPGRSHPIDLMLDAGV
jgi:hypothetical protein